MTCRKSICENEVYADDMCMKHYYQDKHASRVHDVFDDPLCWLLSIVVESNCRRYLEDHPRCIAKGDVKACGFTSNQQEWIEEITGKDVERVMTEPRGVGGGGDEL